MSTDLKCILCGGVSFDTIHERVEHREGLNVVKCRTCGFVSLSSTDHITDTYYQTQKMNERQRLSWADWVRDTKRDDLRRYYYLREQIRGKALLDIGCGNLGFLQEARMVALVNGVEPDRTFEAHCNPEIHGYKVFHDTDEALDDSQRYDFITLFHVIEHLVDPVTALKHIRELLAPGGRLIIETPNANDALLTFYKSKAFANFTYWDAHVHLYSWDTLMRVAGMSGYSKKNIIQIQRYPLSNHLHWLAKGLPGGHISWGPLFRNAEIAYDQCLMEMGLCDTLWGEFQ